jgi:hypothetical protein
MLLTSRSVTSDASHHNSKGDWKREWQSAFGTKKLPQANLPTNGRQHQLQDSDSFAKEIGTLCGLL